MSLNRTSVGLKHYKGIFERFSPFVPQSNQRGIETLMFDCSITNVLRWPQSNQRGIETGPGGRHIAPGTPPQSNQCGIETQAPHHPGHPASIEPVWD